MYRNAHEASRRSHEALWTNALDLLHMILGDKVYIWRDWSSSLSPNGVIDSTDHGIEVLRKVFLNISTRKRVRRNKRHPFQTESPTPESDEAEQLSGDEGGL